jgi:hypothetical protein
MRRTIVAVLASFASTGCAGSLRNPYFYTSPSPPELVRRFTEGAPIDKIGVAQLMAANDCAEGVPIILDDIRALQAGYRCDPPVPESDEVQDGTARTECHVSWRGKAAPARFSNARASGPT